MIVGIGIDIVDIKRFKLFCKNQLFLDKCFSGEEISLNTESLAARFAAKEALYKALDDKTLFRWEDIKIVTNPDGSPEFKFLSAIEIYAKSMKIHISLSHERDTAIAFVIIEKPGN
jgi:holo-[acyl-carrier protein] synthase